MRNRRKIAVTQGLVPQLDQPVAQLVMVMDLVRHPRVPCAVRAVVSEVKAIHRLLPRRTNDQRKELGKDIIVPPPWPFDPAIDHRVVPALPAQPPRRRVHCPQPCLVRLFQVVVDVEDHVAFDDLLELGQVLQHGGDGTPADSVRMCPVDPARSQDPRVDLLSLPAVLTPEVQLPPVRRQVLEQHLELRRELVSEDHVVLED
jgi:hypothetical protein